MTVYKSMSFHINSGDEKHWKVHKGLKLSKGGPTVAHIQSKWRIRGFDGGQPGLSMGQMKQEVMLTLISFSLSY